MTGQTILTIKVFLEDSFTPLNNVRIRLTPLDTKDSKKPKDETQESISQNGVLRFNLPSNANTFELTILDTRFLEKAKGDNIKTTNNYSNTPNPTITLNLIGKPSLCFNGYELQIHQNNKIIQSFKAYSGNALSEQEKVDLQNNKSYKKFVAHEYTDSAQNIIQYFCLDKDYQKQKDKGAIPEGIYYINISQSKENKQSGIREYNNAWYSFSRSKEGEKQWGKYNIPIYTDKDCTNTTESSTKRQGFYIHGGESYGDNGGIDLAKEINGFIASIQRFSNQALMSNAIESNNTIPITLLVEYTHILSNTDLQSIYLHREIQKADSNTHTTEKHRVVLTANYIKPDSMSAESFNAQKQQTYWAYKELSQTEEYNTDTILLSELQFFKRNNQKHRGEQIEINLIEHQWHNYDKQILVFAFSPKDITENERGEEMIENPKWRIITRGFRYDMLKRVFNGINYALLDTTPTTQAQRNQYNEVSAKVQKLKDMVDELNRLHTDNEPMFVHYRLDTTLRLNHFFGQVLVEVRGSLLELIENLYYTNAQRLLAVFPTSFRNAPQEANRLISIVGRNNRERAIANYVYSNRRDLGNQGKDDGYNFRGRGMIHLTGRNNYRNFTIRAREWEWIDNAIDFEVNPDLLFENGGYAIMSAAYFWRQNNCFVNANTDTRASVDSVTRIINRYTDSYQARWNQYERIRDDRIFDEDWLH